MLPPPPRITRPGGRPILTAGRVVARAAVTVLSGLLWAGALATSPPPSVGETLYRHGLLNCHRRSGLGSIEGRIAIPPIAGPYLFVPRGKSLAQLGIPFVDTARINHDPYTDESLARAIREGIGANGKTLNYLMPRYQIDDATMAELIGYLKGIKVSPSPGVSTAVLHFATIITPDADPVKRRGMLAVMDQYFVDKNNAMARTKVRGALGPRRQQLGTGASILRGAGTAVPVSQCRSPRGER